MPQISMRSAISEDEEKAVENAKALIAEYEAKKEAGKEEEKAE